MFVTIGTSFCENENLFIASKYDFCFDDNTLNNIPEANYRPDVEIRVNFLLSWVDNSNRLNLSKTNRLLFLTKLLWISAVAWISIMAYCWWAFACFEIVWIELNPNDTFFL